MAENETHPIVLTADVPGSKAAVNKLLLLMLALLVVEGVVGGGVAYFLPVVLSGDPSELWAGWGWSMAWGSLFFLPSLLSVFLGLIGIKGASTAKPPSVVLSSLAMILRLTEPPLGVFCSTALAYSWNLSWWQAGLVPSCVYYAVYTPVILLYEWKSLQMLQLSRHTQYLLERAQAEAESTPLMTSGGKDQDQARARYVEAEAISEEGGAESADIESMGSMAVNADVEAPSKAVIGDRGHSEWFNVGACSLALVQEFARINGLTMCGSAALAGSVTSNGGPVDPDSDWTRCIGMDRTELPTYLLHLYTHDKWYRPLNNIIMERQTQYYPIIKAMVFGLVDRKFDAPFLYRGFSGVGVDASKKRYKCYTFTSTTTDLETADKCFGEDVVFVIKTNSHTMGADIQDISYYGGESEVLLVPFQEFIVTGQSQFQGKTWVMMEAAGMGETKTKAGTRLGYLELKNGMATLTRLAILVGLVLTIPILVLVLTLYCVVALLRKLFVIPYFIVVNDYNVELRDFCRFQFTQSEEVELSTWGELRTQYARLNRVTATLKYLSFFWLFFWISVFYCWIPTVYFLINDMSTRKDLPRVVTAIGAFFQRTSLCFGSIILLLLFIGYVSNSVAGY